MAYDPDFAPASLISQGVGGTEGLRWFALYWVDPIATVLTPGYISNAAELGMRPGDTLRYTDTNRGEWDYYDLVVQEVDAAGAGTVAFPELPPEALPTYDDDLDPSDNAEVPIFLDGRQYRVPIDQAAAAILTGNGVMALNYTPTGGVPRTIRSRIEERRYAADFEVVADGTLDGLGTDNASKLQTAIDYCIANRIPELEMPYGYCVVREPVTIVNPDFAFRLVGPAMRGCFIVMDYEDVGGFFIDATRYDDQSIAARPRHLLIEDISFVHSTNVTPGRGPGILKKHRCTDLRVNRVHASLSGGTAFDLRSIFNSTMSDVTVFGAGHHVAYKATSGVTFAIGQDSTTLTASASHFTADDIGETIRLEGSPMALFVIEDVNSGTEAVVSEPSVRDHLAGTRGAWGTISASTTADSNAVTLKAARLTAADIGRLVVLTDAKAGNDGLSTMGNINGNVPLVTTITGVSGTTVTLEHNATATTSRAELYFPACYFGPDFGTVGLEGINSNTNDFVLRDVNIEQFSGAGMIFDECVNTHADRVKLHAQNALDASVSDLNQSDVNLMVIKSAMAFRGDIEGVVVNSKGQVHVYGQIGNFVIDDITGAQGENQPFLYWDNDEQYGRVIVGDVTRNNYISGRTLQRLVATKNPTPAPMLHGSYTAYRSDEEQLPNLAPIKQAFGSAQDLTELQSYQAAVVSRATADGFEVLMDGGIPTFKGRRTDPSSNFEVLARLAGHGVAPDGNSVEVGAFDIYAANPSGAIVEGRAILRLRNSSNVFTDVVTFGPSSILPPANNARDLGSSDLAWRRVNTAALNLIDGITEPGASAMAALYIDSADGSLKIRFSSGTIKTIATDP